MVDVFSTRLKSLRKSKRMTQLELSNAAGIARNTYSGYENGAYMPSAEVLVRIAAALGVSTDYLVTGKEEEKKPTEALKTSQVGGEMDVGSQLELILFYLRDGGLPVSYKGHKLNDDERAMIIDYLGAGVKVLNKISYIWKEQDGKAAD